MGKYIIKRLIQMLLALVIVSFGVFMIINLIPGTPAEVLAGTNASEEQLQGMKKYLCRRYRKNDVTFDIREDASLLGGFILKAGDFEYDYSLDGRLKRLQHKLTRR